MKTILYNLCREETRLLSVLRADFYKLLRMKSFYICGIIAMLLSVLNIGLSVYVMKTTYASIPASYFGFNGLVAFQNGLSSANLFFVIFISLFVSGEFTYGTIKNMVSSGRSRVSIYFSKIVSGISVVVIYSMACALVSGIIGTIAWGIGDNITRNDYLDLFRTIGLYILAEISRQCLFVMVGFIFKNSGSTVAINLLIAMGVFSRIFSSLVDKLINNIPNIKDFSLEKYLPSHYCIKFLSLDITQDTIITGIIVCLVAIVVFSMFGYFIFEKRDIN